MAILLFGIAIVVTGPCSPPRARRRAAAGQLARTNGYAGAQARRARHRARPRSLQAWSRRHRLRHLASQLLTRPPDIGGFRTLMTGETGRHRCRRAGVDLAKAMADAGADVMLVDWSPRARRRRDDRRRRAPASPSSARAGSSRMSSRAFPAAPPTSSRPAPPPERGSMLDPDQLNLALDALDTAYDHIVVVGASHAARALFEAIQGRFDAGVIVSERKRRVTKLRTRPARSSASRSPTSSCSASSVPNRTVGPRPARAAHVQGRGRGAPSVDARRRRAAHLMGH